MGIHQGQHVIQHFTLSSSQLVNCFNKSKTCSSHFFLQRQVWRSVPFLFFPDNSYKPNHNRTFSSTVVFITTMKFQNLCWKRSHHSLINRTYMFHCNSPQHDGRTLAGCLMTLQLLSHSSFSAGQWDNVKQRDKDREITLPLTVRLKLLKINLTYWWLKYIHIVAQKDRN